MITAQQILETHDDEPVVLGHQFNIDLLLTFFAVMLLII